MLVLQRVQSQLGKSNDFLSTVVNRTLLIEGADAKKKRGVTFQALAASPVLPAAALGKLQPLTPSVETKFDLQRPFLSGLGSIRDFSCFSGGRGVISRFCLEKRAQEAV